jgi:hypothetical protein
VKSLNNGALLLDITRAKPLWLLNIAPAPRIVRA